MSKTPLTPKNGNVRNFSNGGDFGLSAVKDPKKTRCTQNASGDYFRFLYSFPGKATMDLESGINREEGLDMDEN